MHLFILIFSATIFLMIIQDFLIAQRFTNFRIEKDQNYESIGTIIFFHYTKQSKHERPKSNSRTSHSEGLER